MTPAPPYFRAMSHTQTQFARKICIMDNRICVPVLHPGSWDLVSILTREVVTFEIFRQLIICTGGRLSERR